MIQKIIVRLICVEPFMMLKSYMSMEINHTHGTNRCVAFVTQNFKGVENPLNPYNVIIMPVPTYNLSDEV